VSCWLAVEIETKQGLVLLAAFLPFTVRCSSSVL